MFKKFFVLFVAYGLMTHGTYATQIKNLDKAKVKNLIANDIDFVIRKQMQHVGKMQSFESRPCEVGTIYNFYYDTGFKVEVQFNDQYNDFTILEYKFDIKDPKQKKKIQSLCPLPGFIAPLKNQYESSSKISSNGFSASSSSKSQISQISSSASSSLIASSEKYNNLRFRLGSGISLSVDQKRLCQEIANSKNFPQNCILKEHRFTDHGQWIFDFIIDEQPDYIYEYIANFNLKGYPSIINQTKYNIYQRNVSKNDRTVTINNQNQNINQNNDRTVTVNSNSQKNVNIQKKVQKKAQKQVKQFVKNQKTVQKIVQKIVQQKQQKQVTSKLNHDSNLQFISVLPTDKQMTPYVGLAVDALKYQLKEESDHIILLEVYSARKNSNIIVIKLVCHNTQKNTKFDFLFESQIQKIENIQQSKVVREYEIIPTEILQLPQFSTFMKKFLAENKAQKHKIKKVQWGKKDNRRIKFDLCNENQKKDYQLQTKNQYIESFFKDLERKKAQTKPIVIVQKSANPIHQERVVEKQKVQVGKQTVVVNIQKNYASQKISQQDSPKLVFAEKQQKIISKVEPKSFVQQYDLTQYEQIPIEIMGVKSFEDMIIRILQKNNVTQYKIKLISWKKNDNNDILIVMENDLKDIKYVNTKISNLQGVFQVNKSQKQKIREEVVKQNLNSNQKVISKSSIVIVPQSNSYSQTQKNYQKQQRTVKNVLKEQGISLQKQIPSSSKSTSYSKTQSSININGQVSKSSHSEVKVNGNVVSEKDIKDYSSLVEAPRKDIQIPKPTKPVIINTSGELIQAPRAEVKTPKQTIVQLPKKCQFKYEDTSLDKLPFTKNDPQLLAFISSKLQNDFTTSPVFNQMLDYIAESRKFSTTSQFKVVLFNQMKFGVRFVIQELKTNKLYETVVQLHQKADNSYSFSLESWKQLKSLHQISVNPFSTYNKLIERDTDMQSMLLKSLSKGTGLQNIKKLESVEKKVASNGVYYKCIFNTKDDNQYLAEFLYNPEIDFSEILSYQQINMPYDSKNQEDYTIPYDKDFIEVEEALIQRFPDVFFNARVVYVKKSPLARRIEGQNAANFRIILISRSGRFEVILSYDYDTKAIKIYRLQQLDQGFKMVGLSDKNTQINQDVISNARAYLGRLSSLLRPELAESIKNQKIKFNEELIQMNDFENYGQFIKVTYREPIPVSFTIFEDKRVRKEVNDHHHHPISLTSIDELPVYPTNAYYSDKLFNGYKEIYPSELQFNREFPKLLQKARKDYSNILNRPNKIVGVFSKEVSDKSYYKIVFNVEEKDIYIGTCEYSSKGDLYQVLSVQKSDDLTIDGTYRDNCQKFEKSSSQCVVCQKGFIQTAGRCYKQITGCNVQIGQNCYLCTEGFVRGSDNICYKNPEKTLDTNQNIKIVTKVQVKQAKKEEIPKFQLPQVDPIKVVQSTVNYIPKQLLNSKEKSQQVSKASVQSESCQDSSKLTTSSGSSSNSYVVDRVVKKQYKEVPQTKVQTVSTIIRHSSNSYNDPNCVTYNGPICTYCAYRFYLKDGVCRKVPDTCSSYNKETGDCTNCYTGFYLAGGDCIGKDPLCASTNSRGQCTDCYKNYALINGKCYYQNYSQIRTQSQKDPLCKKYNQKTGKCVQCIQGSYMNSDGVCGIADPNCSQFNEKLGICQRCIRGYEPVNGKCVRKTNQC